MKNIYALSFICTLIVGTAHALQVDILNAVAIDPRYQHSVQLLMGMQNGTFAKQSGMHTHSPCAFLSAHEFAWHHTPTLLSFLEKQPVPIVYTLEDMQAHIPDFSNPRILKNCVGTLVLTLIDIWCATCFEHHSPHDTCTRIPIRSLKYASKELAILTATAQLVRTEAKKYSYNWYEDNARTDPQERTVLAQLGQAHYYYGIQETRQALYATVVESEYLREILQTAQKKEKIARLKKSCCVS